MVMSILQFLELIKVIRLLKNKEVFYMCCSGLETIGYLVNVIFIPLWETGVSTIVLGLLIYYLFYTLDNFF